MKGVGKGGKYLPQGGNAPPNNRTIQSQAVPRNIKKTPTFSTAAFAKATNISSVNNDDLDRRINTAIYKTKVRNPTSVFKSDFLAKNKLLNELAGDKTYAEHIKSDGHPDFTKVTIAITIEYYGADKKQRIIAALDDLIDPLSGRSGVIKKPAKSVKTGHNIDDENLVNGVVTTTTGSFNNTTNGSLNNATGGSVNYGVRGATGGSVNYGARGGFNYNYGGGSSLSYNYGPGGGVNNEGGFGTEGGFNMGVGNRHISKGGGRSKGLTYSNNNTNSRTKPSNIRRGNSAISSYGGGGLKQRGNSGGFGCGGTGSGVQGPKPILGRGMKPKPRPPPTERVVIPPHSSINNITKQYQMKSAVTNKNKKAVEARAMGAPAAATSSTSTNQSYIPMAASAHTNVSHITSTVPPSSTNNQPSAPAAVIAGATGILTSNPNNIDALVRRGKAYQVSGEFLCAARDFDNAIMQNPQDPGVLKDLVLSLDDCINTLLADYIANRSNVLPKRPASYQYRNDRDMQLRDFQLKLFADLGLDVIAAKYGRTCVPAHHYGPYLEQVDFVGMIHFPPWGQSAEDDYGQSGCKDSYPPNKSLHPLYSRLGLILSEIFNIPHQVGGAYLMRRMIIMEALSIDGPPKQADKGNPFNDEYKKIMSEAELKMVEFNKATLERVKPKFLIAYSEATWDFIKANPTMIPSEITVINSKMGLQRLIKQSPHPCKITLGRLWPVEAERFANHGTEMFKRHFQVPTGIIECNAGAVDRILRDANWHLKDKRFGYELWENTPDEGTLLMRIHGACGYITNQIPIDNTKKSIVKGLKVGEYKKIDLGNSILKGRNRQEYSNLYFKKIEFSDDADDFKEPGVFPLVNPSTVGKENKANQGGPASKAVALHLKVTNTEGEYIIEERTRVVQVGTAKHACALVGRGNQLLQGLEEGEKRPITAKNKEQKHRDTPAGAELIAIKATEFDEGHSTSSSPKFGGRIKGKGPEFGSISLSFPDRIVPDHLYADTLSNDALAAINKYHTDNKEWKKWEELLADGDVKEDKKKKKRKNKKKKKKDSSI